MNTLDFYLEVIEMTEEPDELGNHRLTVDLNKAAVKFLTSYGLRHLLIASATEAIRLNEIYESDLYDSGC